MPKYLSGRVKRRDQAYLSTDRYQYLGLDQAEPNLGDPADPLLDVPTGSQFQIISVRDRPGERFWVPITGGIQPGAVTVREEGTIIPNSNGINSITDFNFKGDAITVEGFVNSDGSPGTAVTITVAAPGTDHGVIFNNDGEFATSSFFTFNNSIGIGSVGIGTNDPTENLHVVGNLRLESTIVDEDNFIGNTGDVLVKTVTGGLKYTSQGNVNSGAAGTFKEIQFHDSTGLLGGADNFVYDFTNERIGIGSTQPTSLLDVLGNSKFVGVATFKDDVKFYGSAGVTSAFWDKSDDRLKFNDESKATFGTGNDLEISHTVSLKDQTDSNGDSVVDGRTSLIEESGSGGLIFKSNGGDGPGAYQFFDQSWQPLLKMHGGSNARAVLYHEGLQKFITTEHGIEITGTTDTDQLNVSGVSTFQDDIFIGVGATVGFGTTAYFRDNARAVFGDNENLAIYFNGNNSVIEDQGSGNTILSTNGNGVFITKNNGSASIADFRTDESVILYHNGNEKFRTTNEGILVSGGTTTGDFRATGVSTFVGLSTFSSNVFVEATIDTNQLNVSGVSTFAGITTVTGHTLFTKQLNVAGISTFKDNAIVEGSLTVGNDAGITGGAPTDQGNLAVYGNGRNSLIIQAANNNQDRGMAFRNNGDYYVAYISAINMGSNNADLSFGSGTGQAAVGNVTERIRIKHDTGNVGIGSAIPTVKLDVDGSLHVSDNVGIGSTIPIARLDVFGQTELDNLNVSGVSTFQDDIFIGVGATVGFGTTAYFRDNAKVVFGNDEDLRIYHAGDHSYIDEFGTGNLRIRSNNFILFNTDRFSVNNEINNQNLLDATVNGGVILYQGSNEKIKTTNEGVLVSGGTTTGTLSVTGVSTHVGFSTFKNGIFVTGVSTFTGNILPDSNESQNIGSSGKRWNTLFVTDINATGGSIVVDDYETNTLQVNGISTFIGLSTFANGIQVVSGTATFDGDIDANGNLDVDGHTELDQLNVSGVTTFAGITTVTGNTLFAKQLNVSGISSASAFANFDYLQAPYGSTVTFDVTVAAKSGHRYQGQDSGNAYLINGVQAPILTLTPGRTYRFNNNNTGSHPLKFYYKADRTTLYTTGVNFQNTYTEITISDTTPNVLHYQCTNHGLMGNAVITNSNVVDTPYDATFKGGIDVDGDTTLDITTIDGLLDINAGGQANTFKVEDLTSGRVVLAGTGGELEDSANLTFNGSLLDVTGDGAFSGNVSIAGTLTYEDVTNVDSIGIITARKDVHVGAGLTVVGLSTFNNNVTFVSANGNNLLFDKDDNSLKFGDSVRAKFGASTDMEIYHTTAGGGTNFIKGDGNLTLQSNVIVLEDESGNDYIRIDNGGAVKIHHPGTTEKIRTTSTGVQVTGLTDTDHLNVSGVSTFVGITTQKSTLFSTQLSNSGVSTFFDTVNVKTTGGSVIQDASGTLDLRANIISLKNSAGSGTYAVFNNGSSSELRFNDSKKIETTNEGVLVSGGTTTGTLSVTGVSTFQDDIFIGVGATVGFGTTAYFRDNARAVFGDDEDLSIYHDGEQSYLSEQGTGGFRILTSFFRVKNPSDNSVFLSAANSSVNLFSDGEQRLQTTEEGILVSGGTTTGDFRATGVSTFVGLSTFSSNIFVEATTDTNQLNVSGVSTFVGVSTFNSNIFVEATTDTNQLNVAGISTFNDNAIIDGTLTVGSNHSAITGGAPTDQGNLAVYGTGKNSLIIQTTSNSDDRGIAWRNSGDAYVAYISAVNRGDSTADLRFGVDNANNSNVDLVDERMRITKEGNVGINSTAPIAKLDVDGSFHVSGISTFAGITTVTGSTLFAKDVNVSGVSTFSDNILPAENETKDIGSSLKRWNTLFVNEVNASGGSIVVDNYETNTLQVNGISTFVGLSTFNDGIIVESGISTFADVIKSTVAAGTAPFVVASNTKVVNLNADLLDDKSTANGAVGNSVVIRNAAAGFDAGDVNFANINSSGILTASSAVFNGNVSIAGTLTYEDVTNVDAIGIITARSGIHVTGAGVSVSGISTFINNVEFQDKVGIGSTNPAYTLDFGKSSASTIRLISEYDGTAIRIGPGGSGNNITLLRVDGHTSRHMGESDDSSYGFSLKYMGQRTGNNNSFSLFADNSEGTQFEAITVLQDGKVGIKDSSPSYELEVNGTVAATNFDSLSDQKLKLNIKKIESPIEIVNKIDGVTFNWKKDNVPSMGVIAQNVEKVLPQIVSGDDTKSVNYSGLIGLLIEVVKDQQKQIDELRDRLDK